jgi:hypothetical protein
MVDCKRAVLCGFAGLTEVDFTAPPALEVGGVGRTWLVFIILCFLDLFFFGLSHHCGSGFPAQGIGGTNCPSKRQSGTW